MSHQLTFVGSEFNNKRRKTRKDVFLSRMDELMPWDQLETVIEPFYPKVGKGSRLYPLSAMEDALYKITSMGLFAELSLGSVCLKLESWPHYHHEF